MKKKPKIVFVMMPFKKEKYDDLYENYIKRIIEHRLVSVKAFRVDKDNTTGERITKEIEDTIKDENCVFAIADITERNLNVYYEIGYARALGKTVILIKNKQIGKLPFDTRDLPVPIIYDRDKHGYNDIENQIIEYLKKTKYAGLVKKTKTDKIYNRDENNPLIGIWKGHYWVRKTEHRVVLYIAKDDKEEYSAHCFVDIVNYKGIDYKIRQTFKYNHKLEGVEWCDSEWVEFIGTTHANESTPELDYLLDAYAINKETEGNSLHIKIWDKVNKEKKNVFFKRI